MKAAPTLAQIDGLALAALAGLTAAVYVAGAQPLIGARSEAARQEKVVETRRGEADDAARKLAGTATRLANVSRLISENAVTLQTLDRTNARVAELTDLATERRLEINEIKPGEPLPTSRYVRVPIRMTGSGSFLSCALFMHELRTRFGDTGLTAFDLTGDASSSGDAIRFTFDLTWYTAPDARASAEPGGGG